MDKAKVVLLCTVAAAAYGIAHDLITIRVCAEYFTLAHPSFFPTNNPVLLALCWGVASTVWAGAAVGLVLALVAQSEGQPPVSIQRLLRAVVGLLGVMAVCATIAGALGFELSRRSIVAIPTAAGELIPSPQHHRFMAVWFAHIASYLSGLCGGALVIRHFWHQRGRPAVLPLFPATGIGAIRVVILVAVVAAMLYFRLRGT